MDSSYTYQSHLTLIKQLRSEEEYEDVLYQNKYFSFRWHPYSPYGDRMTTICNIGVSTLMNELKQTLIDFAIIEFVVPILYNTIFNVLSRILQWP